MQEKPIVENIYFGENPENFKPEEDTEYTIDQCEPLPKKYLDKLPDYFKIFCTPMIAPNKKVVFNMDLTEEFYSAYRIHYKLKANPPQDKLLKTLDEELKIALNGLF
jgi:hypothetical protein